VRDNRETDNTEEGHQRVKISGRRDNRETDNTEEGHQRVEISGRRDNMERDDWKKETTGREDNRKKY